MSLDRSLLINNEYTLGVELGKGGFSAVYLATDTKGRRYAVKAGRRDKQNGIKLESNVYFKIQEEAKKTRLYPHGIPKMYHYAEDVGGHKVLVMEYLGKSISNRIFERNAVLSLKTVLMIGIQAISRLEYLHELGILHRDIKPENLLTGVGKRRTRIYIADFGLASTYHDSQGRHVEESSNKGFCGTYRYASVQTHMRKQQSRRCDLESLLYSLIYAAKRQLPWMFVTGVGAEREQKILEMKHGIGAKELCKGLPRAFVEFVGCVRGLGFDQKPDYERLRRILGGALERRGLRNDRVFDWLEG